MSNPYEEVSPYIHAIIEDNFLSFECPKCDKIVELGADDDTFIYEMKENHDYNYQCPKCNLHVEILITEIC